MLPNALILPHFDCMCVMWYPNLDQKYKNKLQVLQNTSVFVSAYNWTRERTSAEHFDKINWLPIDQRFKQCLSTSIFKVFPEMYPQSGF